MVFFKQVHLLGELFSGTSHEDLSNELSAVNTSIGSLEVFEDEPQLYDTAWLDDSDLKLIRIYAPVGLWRLESQRDEDLKLAWLGRYRRT